MKCFGHRLGRHCDAAKFAGRAVCSRHDHVLLPVGAPALVLKRQAGGIGTTDLLVLVLLAEVAGKSFAADYNSVPEGGVLVITILFWSYVLDWVGYHFPAVKRFLRAPTLVLIENGKILRKNMKAELVTMEELMAQLREKGIEDCESAGCLAAQRCLRAAGGRIRSARIGSLRHDRKRPRKKLGL